MEKSIATTKKKDQQLAGQSRGETRSLDVLNVQPSVDPCDLLVIPGDLLVTFTWPTTQANPGQKV